MSRLVLLFLGACFALGVYAGTGEAAVTYNGHPVRAILVGGIDVSPCSDPSGCVRGLVEVRFHRHHRDHLVRCGHPRHLHVVGTYPFAGERWVNVYACSRNYQWRLPR